jgi:trimeric autotransporter adhesin
MFVRQSRLAIILVLSILAQTTIALGQTAVQIQQVSIPAVTASISAGGNVRFTAPGQVTQIRLEIYNAAGALVYDSGMRRSSVLDWKITDATQAMTDGSYVCAVTVIDLQGKLRQRIGGLSVQAGQVTLQRARAESLTPDQSQALATSKQAKKIEAIEADDAITILTEGKERNVTVTAHDGQDGQVTSTSGALTFRTGDVFSGNEKEQMRVTPEGKVGIGTDNPEATLDVAGTIRARGGIRFEDGTVLTSAGQAQRAGANSTTNLTSVTSPPVPTGASALSGSGTSGRLTKWVDGAAGTLGDANLTEAANGNVGIGTTTPNTNSILHVDKNWNNGTALFVTNGSTGSAALATMRVGINPNNYATDYVSLNILSSTWTPGSAGAFLKGKSTLIEGNGSNFAIGNINNTEPIIFYTTANRLERMRLTAEGNFGIGTATPMSKLDVVGDVRLTGAGNGIIFPDGSKMTTAVTGGGNTPSGTSIVGAINDPTTSGLILDTRLSANVARLNGANVWSGPSVFNTGLSANGALITGVGNPVSATDAANKVYVDTTTVKFMPAAEQLSVGDANGTAPMINLRGGSTCCSGPGGHTPAWFKVFQNGSFVATGNLGIGVSPMQGKGYRTSWDSYKGAFRSGYADNEWDDANVGFFSWAGGSNSTAIGLYALAFGDTNQAESTSSIVFGSGNQVKGAAGFSAGAGNRVCDTYGVALGNNAKSGGPYINGKCDPDTFNIRGLAAVAIGYNVTADQDHTTAMGKFASNNGWQGTFIWSDGSAQQSADTFRNTANNEFAARATGGFRFRTNLGGTTGCNLPAGSGVFNCTSSRYTKENFMMVNGEDVLSRLRNVPVSTWNYISEGKNVRHIGPMAEDFYKAFELGTGNTSIGVQDIASVSIAAVQALETRTAQLQQKSAEVDQLRLQVNELRSLNAAMEQRLAALEQKAQVEQKAPKSKRKQRNAPQKAE